MIVKSKSKFLSLLFTGYFAHFLNPWELIVDFYEETITVQKRNYFLIGKDKQTSAFKFIREIFIDEHLIGASINIKAIGTKISAKCISKKDAQLIKKKLIEYNSQNKKTIIIS